MGRIRSIRPEFFHHVDLSQLSPLHRLLFIGLWTQADREGRLRDSVPRIQIEILPWERCDIDALLHDLDEAEFIQRYEAKGEKYIAIPKFAKHQRPHPKEPKSEFPAPPSRGKKRRAVEKNGEPGKDLVGPRKDHVEPGGDLGDLGDGDLGGGASDAAGGEVAVAPGPLSTTCLFDLWNEKADASLPRAQDFTASRRKASRARLRERPIDAWDGLLARVNTSQFCLGVNDRNWRADFDWFLKPDTATKILEGKYDDRKNGAVKKDPRRGVTRAEDFSEYHRNTPVGVIANPWGDKS